MIKELQAAVAEMPQIDIETQHTFCEGVYAREIKIPAGVVLVGAKHKTSFFVVISQGRCKINDKTYYAPTTFISEIGAKRAIYAVTDTTLTTFHATKLTDIKEIEEAIIDEEDVELLSNNKKGVFLE